MEPAVFGDPPLFGLFHPAPGGSARDQGVLICPPVAYEHIRAHRALRHLAVQLARAGYDVLRFDYFGVGDSAGASEEARVSRWHDDVAAAAAELRALSGAHTLCVVGVRLGATLAATAPELQTDHLVLWDPILDGRAWVQSMERMHQTLLSDLTYFQRPRREPPNPGLLGFAFTPELRADLAELNLHRLARWSSGKVTLVTGSAGEAERKLLGELQGKGLSSGMRVLRAPIDWQSLRNLGLALTTAEATEATLQVLG